MEFYLVMVNGILVVEGYIKGRINGVGLLDVLRSRNDKRIETGVGDVGVFSFNPGSTGVSCDILAIFTICYLAVRNCVPKNHICNKSQRVVYT